MSDANAQYDALMDWGSAVRIGINGTATILQLMVLKGTLTKAEALSAIDDLARVAAHQGSTTSAQKQIVSVTYDQARELLRQM